MWLFVLAACLPDPPKSGLEERVVALELAQADCVTRDELGAALEGVEGEVDALQDEVAGLVVSAADAAHVIAESVTLEVPSAAYPDVHAALDWLDHRLIAHNATVTIALTASATYERTILVDHRDGGRIQIVGDPPVTLSFIGGITGVEVPAGRTLGFLDGVTLVGDGLGGAHGLYVHDNGTAECGETVTVRGFGGDGFFAENGAVILAGGTESTENLGSGYYAGVGSVMRLSSPDTRAVSNGGQGFAAAEGSIVIAGNAVAEGNANSGFYSSYGSFVNLGGASVHDNGGSGLYVYGARAMGRGASLLENTGNGAYALQMSWVYLDESSVASNLGAGIEVRNNSYATLGAASVVDNGGFGVQAYYWSGAKVDNCSALTGNGAGSCSPAATSADSDGSYIH